MLHPQPQPSRGAQRLRVAAASRVLVEFVRLREMALEHEAIITAWTHASLDSLDREARTAKVQRGKPKPKRRTPDRPPQGQRMDWNRERVGDFALQHPTWTWQQIADHFDLGKDYCQQLWARYRAAHNLATTVRKRTARP